MALILDDGESPDDAAETWLKAHPDALGPWLEGVTTLDGEPGLPPSRPRSASDAPGPRVGRRTPPERCSYRHEAPRGGLAAAADRQAASGGPLAGQPEAGAQRPKRAITASSGMWPCNAPDPDAALPLSSAVAKTTAGSASSRRRSAARRGQRSILATSWYSSQRATPASSPSASVGRSSDEVRRLADHLLQPVVPLDDRLPAEANQRRLGVRVGLGQLQRHPERREGAGEAGVEEGHQLVHPVGLGRRRLEADAPRRVARLEPRADRHGLAERTRRRR